MDAQDDSGRAALHWACSWGHTWCVKMLCEIGSANLNLTDHKRETPLILAVIDGKIGCVEVVFKAYCICNTLYYRCVRYLLAQGANPNCYDDSGRCPMHWAATWGHTFCLRYLVQSDANMNAQDHKGETPMILAVISGHIGCLQVFTGC